MFLFFTDDVEFAKRQTLEALIQELTESIEMTERDQEMIKSVCVLL